ncbi:MAG: hypothetical protein LBQ51_01255 [Desulfovibrio sp.]|jgi:hypothetical protein|nr:hypothetical protein [Desulfovibrio sp.]
MSEKKMVTREYIEELRAGIAQGNKPARAGEGPVSKKEFIRLMLPDVRNFLKEGYACKEIAAFLGHVTADDLKKAVERDAEEKSPVRKIDVKKADAKKADIKKTDAQKSTQRKAGR